jgi:hypothetical protein
MCVNFPLPRFCGVCGERSRSLILDTVTGTVTGICCLGKRNAPACVVQDPRDYDELELTPEDWKLLEELRIKP